MSQPIAPFCRALFAKGVLFWDIFYFKMRRVIAIDVVVFLCSKTKEVRICACVRNCVELLTCDYLRCEGRTWHKFQRTETGRLFDAVFACIFCKKSATFADGFRRIFAFGMMKMKMYAGYICERNGETYGSDKLCRTDFFGK